MILLNANRSDLEMTAAGTREGVEIVMGLIRPFNANQEIGNLAVWARG
jgi:hypothetical protein